MFSAFLYKPLRLLHVDLHIQFVVQEYSLDVHLMYLQAHDRSQYKYDSNGVEFGQQCKGFAKINTEHLVLPTLL